MPNKVAVCVVKIETVSTNSEEEETGAVSSEHPTNPRVQRERERDRGLRPSRDITIETYTNRLWSTEENQKKGKPKMNTAKTAVVKCKKHEAPSSSNSREMTPLEEGQNHAKEFPKEIPFFSGNPSVEVTKGLIHLYKKNERKELKEGPTRMLCLLAVPASLCCHDLMSFVAPCHTDISHIRIVRDGCPNQFMVLLDFRTNEAALEFYQTFNGAAYNTLEPDSLCHAVWVSDVEWADHGLPPMGHTELPMCPVCLERMDESVDGVLTILCNHAFHANCLIKWGDSTCPVCRHVQTPELMENSVCMECEGVDSLWICLICGHVGCGRYQGGHAAAHYRATNHCFAMQLGTSSVWDYLGDNFVHRLFQSKTDGKLVATQMPNNEGEEKIDSMQLEFTYLLTSQLETQRKFYEDRMDILEKEWREFKIGSMKKDDEIVALQQKVQTLTKEKVALERKLTQNTAKFREIQKQLSEESQIAKALQNNQNSWTAKYNALEKQYRDYRENRECELHAVKEQLRDIMFYMDAKARISESEFKDEIAGGSVVVPEQDPKPSTSTTATKTSRRKKKH